MEVTESFLQASTIKSEATDWLWQNYLPRGKIMILDGDPGQGKSTLTLDLAARISSGRGFPNEPKRDPANVLIINLDDNAKDTIVPRLMAAEADLTRVHIWTDATPFTFSIMKEAAAKVTHQLIVIDPLMDVMGHKINTNQMSQISGPLNAIKQIAEQANTAVLCVRHLTKPSKEVSNAIYKGMGSMGFIGKARIGFIVLPYGNAKAFACSKTIGTEPPSWLFRLESHKVPTDDGKESDVPRVVWTGQMAQTANEILNGAPENVRRFSIRAQLIAAIASLQGDVKGGYLGVKRIIEPINEEREENQKLDEKTASGILRELGFESKSGGWGARILWNPVLLDELASFYYQQAGLQGADSQEAA